MPNNGKGRAPAADQVVPQSDCDILASLAAYVGNWVTRQPAVKEESLTDWLLFEASNRSPRIRYVAFSRHAEARLTGADWEWWFLFRSANWKFRVQAKKINAVDNYPGLAYSNAHGMQIEKLREDSKAENAIAMYAFYSQPNAAGHCPRSSPDCGVFVAGAEQVYSDFIRPGRAQVSVDALLKRSRPLQCMVCCPLDGAGDMEGFLRHYFATELESKDGDEAARGRHKEAPRYVLQLLAAQGPPASWEQELRHHFAGIGGIAVVDLRESRRH